MIEQAERELQRLVPDRKAKDLEGVADLLRMLGPLTTEEVTERCLEDPVSWLEKLVTDKRALHVSYAGESWWTVVEDAARLRDGLGVPLPIGVPAAFIEPVDQPLDDLLSRYARTHGPFTLADAAARFGLGVSVARDVLGRLALEKRVLEGEFRPSATGSEWCDAEVLRRLRRRSLAAARQEVEPVSTATLGRFLPSWQHVGGTLRGIDGVATVVDQLAGVPIPASALESLILPSRVADYSPAMLDELTSTGEVLWSGSGAISGKDGWVVLHPADLAPITLNSPADTDVSELQKRILDLLSGGGAYFFRQLVDALRTTESAADTVDSAVTTALWELVWLGHIGNDTVAPLRALLSDTTRTTASHRSPRRVPRARPYRGMGPRFHARAHGTGNRLRSVVPAARYRT